MNTKFFLFLFLFNLSAYAETVQQFITVPVKTDSESYLINTLFVTDSTYTNPSLVVISHGSPIQPSYRPQMVPEKLLPQAMEFVKLGFSALIVERRGYGRSKEKYVEIVGDCDHRNNISSGRIASSDIIGALTYAQKNLKIADNQVVLVGHSAGGFSSIFASSFGHPGVRAVINFAGGRGAKGNDVVCSESNLLEAYSFAGKTSRVPTLWIYNENDQAFAPDLARSMFKSFQSSGGTGEFLMLPTFQSDGHHLFSSAAGISIWQPIAKQFLQKVQVCPLCR
jgi:dienelactone hydrolase